MGIRLTSLLASISRSEVESAVRERALSKPSRMAVTLLLDNIRNPDNVGAIIRVAAAAGVSKVIAVKGCADAWSPKCVRAGAGAHFRLQMETRVPWESVESRLPAFPQVVLADLDRSDASSEAAKHVDEAKLSKCLNDLADKCRSFKESSDQDATESGSLDLSYYDEDILAKYDALPLVSRYYDQVSEWEYLALIIQMLIIFALQFVRHNSDQELVVVIGGETEGISAQAKKYAHTHLGERIYVPLDNDVDSLNVVSATSVILFELAKGFRKENTR